MTRTESDSVSTEIASTDSVSTDTVLTEDERTNYMMLPAPVRTLAEQALDTPAFRQAVQQCVRNRTVPRFERLINFQKWLSNPPKKRRKKPVQRVPDPPPFELMMDGRAGMWVESDITIEREVTVTLTAVACTKVRTALVPCSIISLGTEQVQRYLREHIIELLTTAPRSFYRSTMCYIREFSEDNMRDYLNDLFRGHSPAPIVRDVTITIPDRTVQAATEAYDYHRRQSPDLYGAPISDGSGNVSNT